jgi:hypothetical protein
MDRFAGLDVSMPQRRVCVAAASPASSLFVDALQYRHK